MKLAGSVRRNRPQIIKNGTSGDLKISGIEIPSSQFEVDFKSGLSTLLLAEANILKTGKTVAHETLKMKIYYDLWDEFFYIQQLDINSKNIVTGQPSAEASFSFP